MGSLTTTRPPSTPRPSRPGWLQRSVAALRPALTFCAIGVLNTAISYVVYLLILPALPYAVANVVGWAVGLLVSFFANCRFTWRVRPTWTRLARFPISSLPSVVFGTAGVVALVEVFGVDQRLAPLLATVAAIPLSFLLARAALTGRRAG